MAAPYYVTHDAGGAGVGSSGDPFTLTQAIDTVAAGETVYVKASGVYNVEYATGGAKNTVFNTVTPGTRTTPIRWIGYHTTIADGGIVTLDANDALNYALDNNGQAWQIFENFRYIQGALYSALTSGVGCLFKNCSFEDAADRGCYSSVGDTVYLNCRFTGNVEEGFYSLDTAPNKFINCLFYANGKSGCICDADETLFYGCSWWNNGISSSPTAIFGQSLSAMTVINCTFDGENDANAIGIYLPAAANNLPCLVINTIIYDCASGVEGSAASVDVRFLCCLFNSNTANTTNILQAPTAGDGIGNDGTITAAPAFENEAADDYTLGAASPAIGAGWDANKTKQMWDSYDGATNPPELD